MKTTYRYYKQIMRKYRPRNKRPVLHIHSWLAPGEPPVENYAQQVLPGGRVGRAVFLNRQVNTQRTNGSYNHRDLTGRRRTAVNPRKKSPRLNPSWLKWPGFDKGSEDTPGFLVVFFLSPPIPLRSI